MSVFVFMRVEENKKKSLAATTIDKNIDVPMDISHFNPVFNNKMFSFSWNIMSSGCREDYAL